MTENCLLIRTGALSCAFRQKCDQVFILPGIVLKWEICCELDVLHSDTEQLGVNKSVINVLLKGRLKTQRM